MCFQIINERKEYHDKTKYNYLNQFMTEEENDEEDYQIYGGLVIFLYFDLLNLSLSCKLVFFAVFVLVI